MSPKYTNCSDNAFNAQKIPKTAVTDAFAATESDHVGSNRETFADHRTDSAKSFEVSAPKVCSSSSDLNNINAFDGAKASRASYIFRESMISPEPDGFSSAFYTPLEEMKHREEVAGLQTAALQGVMVPTQSDMINNAAEVDLNDYVNSNTEAAVNLISATSTTALDDWEYTPVQSPDRNRDESYFSRKSRLTDAARAIDAVRSTGTFRHAARDLLGKNNCIREFLIMDVYRFFA